MRPSIIVALLVALAIPATVLGVGVAGRDFPKTRMVDGTQLKLLGVGVREKWFFDVYAMGAYSESGSCNTKEIIEKDEMKYIRLEMLRSVGADKMASTIGESFDKAMPANATVELKKQRTVFLSYFKKELAEGNTIEFIYEPATGVVTKQNGEQLGAPMFGTDFMKVFWSIYFGANTCCKELKASILSTCK